MVERNVWYHINPETFIHIYYTFIMKSSLQIISPADKNIQKCILERLEPGINWEVSLSAETTDQSQLEAVEDAYYDWIKAGVYNAIGNADSPNITYTAMHGVGYPYIVRAFREANFKVRPTVQRNTCILFKTNVYYMKCF